MKFKKILGILLSINLVVGFCSNVNAYAVGKKLNQEWSNYHEGGVDDISYVDANDYFNDVIQTSDGGFIAVGLSENLLPEEEPYQGEPISVIVKYNSVGEKEWSSKNLSLQEITSITESSDGGFAVIGHTYQNYADNAVIVKYNSTGSQEWMKIWEGTNYNNFKSVVETNDGGFAVVGYGNSNDIDGLPNDNKNKLVISKFTSTGDKSWTSTVDSKYSSFYDLVETNDGGLIAVGSYNKENSISSTPIAVKYDKDGTQEWIKDFESSLYENLISISKTNDGGFVAISGVDYNLIVVKFNENFDIQWGKLVDMGEGYMGEIKSVVETTDGNIIAVGYRLLESDNEPMMANQSPFATNETPKDGVVVKYDNNGNLMWSESWGTENYNEEFNSVIAINDNDFVVVGSNSNSAFLEDYNSQESDAVIVKFKGAKIVPLKQVSQDLNISIEAENTLEMALSTNTINFANYNGTQDFDKSLTVTVSSGLNYDLTAKLNDEIRLDTDENIMIDKSNLKIKIAEDLEYKNFTVIGEKVNLVTNSSNGKDIVHNVALKLLGDSSVKAGTYNTSITFEAEQK